jgi:heme/copper-type cytochrome/quinol oxidase subunit 4
MEFAMSEQDNELAESDSPQSEAMNDLLSAASAKAPPSPGAKRRLPPQAPPNGMALASVYLGMAANVCIVLGLTSLRWIALVAMVLTAVAGAVCGVIGIMHARVSRRGGKTSLAGLILSSIPMLLVILRVVVGEVWSYIEYHRRMDSL